MVGISAAELLVIGVIGLFTIAVPIAIIIFVVVLVKRSKAPPR